MAMDVSHAGGFERLEGIVRAIPKRGLSEETCRLWDYRVGEMRDGSPCHIANYRDTARTLLAQKLRTGAKDFPVLKDKGTKLPLYGMWLWPNDRRSVIITEGELDALSVSQAQGHKYPVVSVPNGAQGAHKSIKDHYDWLCEFQKIVLMFDNDEPGREAAVRCAEMLPPDKVLIADIAPYKDANEALADGKPGAITQAFWNAKAYRPDGIVTALDVFDDILGEDERGLPYPWDGLNRLTLGARQGELVVITAGSGIGKSTLAREIAYHLHQHHKQTVGMLMLEENNRRTLRSIVGLHLSKNLVVDQSQVTPSDLANAKEELFGNGRELYLFNHFGSTEIDNILNRIRYLAKVCGCRWIILDHLSILISGTESTDERKLIDMAMTKLRTLVEETGIGMYVISHLTRPDGDKGHEDGAKVRLKQLRGSHAIAQLSDMIFTVEKPSDDPTGDTVEVGVAKNRLTGERGHAATLRYDRETGRLTESEF